MGMVEVGDAALYYEVSGHGPAMVFVHGMCGDATVWAGQAGGSPTVSPACTTTGAATPAAVGAPSRSTSPGTPTTPPP